MTHTIETIGNSLVKHGPGNDWAYLMKLDPKDTPEVIESLEQLAISRGYSKIFAKVPASEAGLFIAAKYYLEAAVPDFYPEGVALYFMAKYFKADRKLEQQPMLVRDILVSADAQQRTVAMPLPAEFTFRVATKLDAVEMAILYRKGFANKQFEIHDSASICAAINEGTIFFGLWKGETIVALSSAAIDLPTKSAEISDFSILPEHRGKGLTLHLLQQAEENLLPLGIRSIFTMTRAYSYGININFARNGYSFCGTLTNNTGIYGNLESLNVWHKLLPDDPRFVWKSVFEADPTEVSGSYNPHRWL